MDVTREQARAGLEATRRAQQRLLQVQQRDSLNRAHLAVLGVVVAANAGYLAADDLPAGYVLPVKAAAAAVTVGTVLAIGLSRRVASRIGLTVRLRQRSVPRRYLVVVAVMGAAYGLSGAFVEEWADAHGGDRPHVVIAAVMTGVLVLNVALGTWLLRRSTRAR